MQAFEITGTVDASGQLTLDHPLKGSHSGRFRMIILLEDLDRPCFDNASIPISPDLNLDFSLEDAYLADSILAPNAQPVWDQLADIFAQFPEEEWMQLSRDLARNLERFP